MTETGTNSDSEGAERTETRAGPSPMYTCLVAGLSFPAVPNVFQARG